jgi:hypothetical protein
LICDGRKYKISFQINGSGAKDGDRTEDVARTVILSKKRLSDD